MNELLKRIDRVLRERHQHVVWRRVVSGLMALAVFCTTYALILPAITLETTTYCGLAEHEHTEDCYDAEGTLTCGLEEHTHDDSCRVRPETLTFTSEGEALTITVSLPWGEELPDDLSGEVVELDEDDTDYDAMIDSVGEAIGEIPGDTEADAHLYRINWTSDSNAYTLPETAEITVSAAETDGNSEVTLQGFVLSAGETDTQGETLYTAGSAGESADAVTLTLTGAAGFAVVRTGAAGTVTAAITEVPTRSITVTKEWDDWDDEETTHEDVTVSLYRYTTRTAAVTVGATDGTTTSMDASTFMGLVKAYQNAPDDYGENTAQYIAYAMYERYSGSSFGWTSRSLSGSQYEDTGTDFTLTDDSLSQTIDDLPTVGSDSYSLTDADENVYTISISDSYSGYYVAEDMTTKLKSYSVSYKNGVDDYHSSNSIETENLPSLGVSAAEVPASGKVTVVNSITNNVYTTITLQKEWDAAEEQQLDAVYVNIYQTSMAEIFITTDPEGKKEQEKTDELTAKLSDLTDKTKERGYASPVYEAYQLDADPTTDYVDSYVLNGTDETSIQGSVYKGSLVGVTTYGTDEYPFPLSGRNYIGGPYTVDGVTYYFWSRGIYRYFVVEVYSDAKQDEFEVTYTQDGDTLTRYQVDANDGEEIFACVGYDEEDNAIPTGFECTDDLEEELKDLVKNSTLTAINDENDTTEDISKTSLKLAEITGEGTVTITNTAPTTEVTVTKEWEDSAETHDEVTASLYRRVNRTATIVKTEEVWEGTTYTTMDTTMDGEEFMELVSAYRGNPSNYRGYYVDGDTNGTIYYEKLDADGNTVLDDNGNTVYVDENGSTYEPYDPETADYPEYPEEYIANYVYTRLCDKYSTSWSSSLNSLTGTLYEDTGKDFTLNETNKFTATSSKLAPKKTFWDWGEETEWGGFYFYGEEWEWGQYTIYITDEYDYYVAEDSVPDGYGVSYSDESIAAESAAELSPVSLNVTTTDANGNTTTSAVDAVAVPESNSVRVTNTKYTLNFESNGGTEIPSENYTTAGVTATFGDDAHTPTRDGYTFNGWYADADFSGEPITSVTMDSDKTVYAKWTAENTTTITVTKEWEDNEETHPAVNVSLYRKVTRTVTIEEVDWWAPVLESEGEIAVASSNGGYWSTVNVDNTYLSWLVQISSGAEKGTKGYEINQIYAKYVQGKGTNGADLVLRQPYSDRDEYVDTVTLNAENNWEGTFSKPTSNIWKDYTYEDEESRLYVYIAETYEYYLKETYSDDLENYNVSYSDGETEEALDLYSITTDDTTATVTINNESIGTALTDTAEQWNTGVKVADGDDVVITNKLEKTYVLPETGGTGTLPYTWGGTALTALAAGTLYYRNRGRRRRRGGDAV